MSDDPNHPVSVLLDELCSAEKDVRDIEALVAAASNSGDDHENTDLRQRLLDAAQRLADRRNDLFEVIYTELRQVASRIRGPHSPLGATTLVHQAYTRILRNEWAIDAPSREEFFQRAGRVLQQTLIDQVRKLRSLKAGGALRRVPLDDRIEKMESQLDGHDLIDLEDALKRLESRDAMGADIVRLHFFAAMSFSEIAQALNWGERSVYRKWNETRVWLHSALRST